MSIERITNKETASSLTFVDKIVCVKDGVVVLAEVETIGDTFSDYTLEQIEERSVEAVGEIVDAVTEVTRQKAAEATNAAETAQFSAAEAQNYMYATDEMKNQSIAATETANAAAADAQRFAEAAGNYRSGIAEDKEEADASAIEAKSWAVGGTGTRPGEDTNNAKYWSENTRQAGVTRFNGRSGNVEPMDGDYTPEMLGLGNVANERQYSEQNPPPYPVTSVGGETGDVQISKEKIGLGNVANERQYSAQNPPPKDSVYVDNSSGFAEIEEAISGGKAVFYRKNGKAYHLADFIPGNYAMFENSVGVGRYTIVCEKTGGWGAEQYSTIGKASVGLTNVANERQYSAQNPPPYPKPIMSSVTIGQNWTDNGDCYSQAISLSGITQKSKVDIQPNASLVNQLISDGVTALWIENNNGALTAKCTGDAPSISVTVQCTITELA